MRVLSSRRLTSKRSARGRASRSPYRRRFRHRGCADTELALIGTSTAHRRTDVQREPSRRDPRSCSSSFCLDPPFAQSSRGYPSSGLDPRSSRYLVLRATMRSMWRRSCLGDRYADPEARRLRGLRDWRLRLGAYSPAGSSSLLVRASETTTYSRAFAAAVGVFFASVTLIAISTQGIARPMAWEIPEGYRGWILAQFGDGTRRIRRPDLDPTSRSTWSRRAH